MSDRNALAEVATQLELIATELEATAKTLASRATGKSRELRSWALRIRHQATAIRWEADQTAELSHEPAARSAGKQGLRFAEKALVLLATVSAVADIPNAVDASIDAVEGAREVIERILDTEQESGDEKIEFDPPAESGSLGQFWTVLDDLMRFSAFNHLEARTAGPNDRIYLARAQSATVHVEWSPNPEGPSDIGTVTVNGVVTRNDVELVRDAVVTALLD